MTYAEIVHHLYNLINAPSYSYPNIMSEVSAALDKNGHADAAWHVVMGRHQQALNNLALELANKIDIPNPMIPA